MIFELSPALSDVLSRLFRILVILVLAVAGRQLIARLMPRVVRASLRREAVAETPDEHAKREETVARVVERTLQLVLLLVIGLTLLGELGVNLAPALASIGILGVALGFGAQKLVQDIINGLFILLENQYRKGDVVKIAGVAGLVEDLNLRRTVLRDLDGVVHHVPNGDVRVASNYTSEWSRVNLDVTVAYDADVDLARQIIDDLGQELAADPVFGPMITEPPRFLRVDKLSDTGVVIKVLGVTKPIKQWDVMGELRRRLLIAFALHGIRIPSVQRVAVAPPDPPPATGTVRAPSPTARGDAERPPEDGGAR
ncbi:MAG: mechanosensitive ion channel family protein [Dehalococcoidia bacterium]|nr:mechanosensitive ion channel family protein [Dehalococcoidia bacterium]